MTLFFAGFIFFMGCDKKQNTSTPSTTREKPLAERINELETDVFLLNLQVDNLISGSAIVSTEEKGYAIAQTKYGSFAIVCKNASQYLDGYKVHLNIGNLTNARFNGAKISLKWGKGQHKKEVSVTNDFPPGRYTTVEVVMTPAKPEDIKEFTVGLEFNQMALYK
jgi:hypothetical protein